MMSTITYGSSAPPNIATETDRKSLLLRIVDAIVVSRMRKAEEEIERVRRFWPDA
jgi:hypothetical protein